MSKLISMLCLIGVMTLAQIGTSLGQCKLDEVISSDPQSGDNFGLAVATDGDFVIVGAQQHSHFGEMFEGAAYIFQRQGSVWNETQELTASNHDANDNFGQAVAISGPFAVVGAPGVNHSGALGGAAYIFENVGGNWVERTFLVPSDSAAFQTFARSVDIDGDYAVVGSPNDGQGGIGSGAVYVFQRQGQNWVQQAKLTASNPALFAGFGADVDIEGDRILIGASGLNEFGSAYIFERSGSSWNERAILTPDQPQSRDAFGFYVALSASNAVVGASISDAAGEDVGAVYVFTGSGQSWSQSALLTPGDPTGIGSFGSDVAVRGDTLLVGAAEIPNRLGLMYVFRNTNGIWTENARLEEFDQTFAQSIDLDSFAVAGAWLGRSANVFDVDLVEEIVFEIDPNESVFEIEIEFPGQSVQVFQAHITGTVCALFNRDCGDLSTVQVPEFDLRPIEDQFNLIGPKGEQLTITDVVGRAIDPGAPADLEFDMKTMAYDGVLTNYLIEIAGDAEIDFDFSFGHLVTKCLVFCFFGDEIGPQPIESIVVPGIDIEGVVDLGFGSMNPRLRITGQIEATVGHGSVPASIQSVNVVTGTPLAGGVAELDQSDDSYFQTRSGFGQTLVDLHHMEMTVNASTTVASPTLLDISIESYIDHPTGIAQIRLFNWSTKQFDLIGNYSVGDTEATHELANIPAANYVNTSGGGEIVMSIKQVVFVPFFAFTFESFFDRVVINVE